jgi:hypothetical protein
MTQVVVEELSRRVETRFRERLQDDRCPITDCDDIIEEIAAGKIEIEGQFYVPDWNESTVSILRALTSIGIEAVVLQSRRETRANHWTVSPDIEFSGKVFTCYMGLSGPWTDGIGYSNAAYFTDADDAMIWMMAAT